MSLCLKNKEINLFSAYLISHRGWSRCLDYLLPVSNRQRDRPLTGSPSSVIWVSGWVARSWRILAFSAPFQWVLGSLLSSSHRTTSGLFRDSNTATVWSTSKGVCDRVSLSFFIRDQNLSPRSCNGVPVWLAFKFIRTCSGPRPTLGRKLGILASYNKGYRRTSQRRNSISPGGIITDLLSQVWEKYPLKRSHKYQLFVNSRRKRALFVFCCLAPDSSLPHCSVTFYPFGLHGKFGFFRNSLHGKGVINVAAL